MTEEREEGLLPKAIDEIESLIDGVVPLAFPPEQSWGLVAAAFLARFADQLRAIAILLEQDLRTDALMLVREIYEHAVVFCWIAADPDQRLEQWMDHSARSSVVTLKEAEDLYEISPPAHIDMSNEDLERLLPLAQLAAEADAHWSAELPAFRPQEKGGGGLLTLRGLYTGLYRTLSRSAHAEVETVDAILRPRPTQWVVSREKADKRHLRSGVLTLSVGLVALAMVVYDHDFGGFDVEVLEQITQSLHPDSE